MNTPNPTHDPRPERQPAYDAVYAVIRRYPPRSTGDYERAAENGRIWRAVEAALDAMDLPARDARVRAETLRWAAAQWDAKAERSAELPSANLGQSWQRYQLTESLTGVAEWCRAEATAIENGANAPAESVAAGSVVSTEGSGHPHPHGDDDGHDGYMSTRCEEGRPGCVGRGCICRCHADQPGPGPWTGPRPTLSVDTEGDTDANH